MTKRAALYLRFSTDGQETGIHSLELKKVAAAAGWEIVAVYGDRGITDANGGDNCPEFNRLSKDAARRQFDVVMAWSVDRLACSLQDLVRFLEELNALKVDLYLHQQDIDTTTPAGRSLFRVLGVFAEFERSMIQERVEVWPARAKAQGKTLGRPKISAEVEAEILPMRAAGYGKRKIAKSAGVGVGTVMRVTKAHEEAGALTLP